MIDWLFATQSLFAMLFNYHPINFSFTSSGTVKFFYMLVVMSKRSLYSLVFQTVIMIDICHPATGI